MSIPIHCQASDSPSPPLIRQELVLKGFDPDQLREIISGARFEHYILTHAPCEVRHRRWSCGTFSVDIGRYSFPARAMGAFPEDRICIGYMRTMKEPTWINGMDAGLDSIQLYPAGSELNYRAGKEAEWVAIEFEEGALQKAAVEQLGHPLSLPQGGASNIPVPQEDRAALDRMVEHSMNPEAASGAHVMPILRLLAEILGHSQHGTLDTMSRRWRHRDELLRKAEAFLQSRVGMPFDGKALAAAVGTTERSLQIHFLQAYGLTPSHWARCLALHQVRNRLRRQDAARFSIEGMARDCGFRHMGRFAAYYHDLFGELPSQTLQSSAEAGVVRV